MQFLRIVVAIVFMVSLVACGGGGSGGDQRFGSTTDTMLSGQVLAPNGALASLENKNFGDKLLDVVLPTVLADFSGVAPIANATVELIRLNLTGSIDGIPLATTTSNANGGYSFNLTDLGVTPETTLAVRVGGGFLRAFVTGTDVDITVESEAVFRRVVAEVGGTNQLTNYTPAEIEALVLGLRRVTSGAISGGGNINDAVTDATQDLSPLGNVDLDNFADSAAASTDEETQAPGNSANYFPLTQGAQYTYIGNSSLVAGTFTNVITVSGIQTVNGVNTTAFASTNLVNQGPDTSLIGSNLLGVFDYSFVNDDISSIDEPLPLILFPNIDNVDIIFAGSIDIDGVDFNFTYTGIEILASLMVQGTPFNNVLHTRATLNEIGGSIQAVQDSFFAPNVGLVRQTNTTTGGGLASETITEDLVSVTGL